MCSRLLQATEKRPLIIYCNTLNAKIKCLHDTHIHISHSLAYFTRQRISCLCVCRLRHLSLRQLRQSAQVWAFFYPALLGVSREPAMTALIVDCER